MAIPWANVDLEAAVTWASALPESAQKDALTVSRGYEIIRVAPTTALTIMSPLTLSPERDDLLAHAVSQWAVTHSAEAISWAQQVSGPALREQLLASVAVGLAEQDGAAAASLAAESLHPGPEQDRTVVAVVQRWAQKSPQEAAAWWKNFRTHRRALRP